MVIWWVFVVFYAVDEGQQAAVVVATPGHQGAPIGLGLDGEFAKYVIEPCMQAIAQRQAWPN